MKKISIIIFISVLLYSCGSMMPGLPTSSTGEIIKHKYYTLSYYEKYEQAEWVAYKIDSAFILTKMKRTNNFKEDTAVHTGSATLSDYRKSGYDRGHLCPAADMHLNKQAMKESFYMSNMSPQKPEFNRGAWRELEELVRDWTLKEGKLYIVTGPVLEEGLDVIGDNEVAVPKYYYKVLFDYTEPEIKGIAFLMPNELINKPLSEYSVPIDSIEELTGIDFFYELRHRVEKQIESENDFLMWDK